MKITQATLKAIIQEEIAKMAEERNEPADVAHADRVLSGEEEAESGAEALKALEEETADHREDKNIDSLWRFVRDLRRELDDLRSRK